MALNFKKSLLAGTALVAVSFAHIGAASAQNELTINGSNKNTNYTWGEDGDSGSGQAVIVNNTATLNVNTGDADIGPITAGANNDQTLTLGLGAGIADSKTTAISGIGLGGSATKFSVIFDGANLAHSHKVSVVNSVDVGATGAITLTSAQVLDLVVGGDVTAGAINLNGANTRLNLSGNSKQTVAGNISGGGNITVNTNNADGAEFVGNVAAKEILFGSNGTKATFKGATTTITDAINVGAGKTIVASGAAFNASLNLNAPDSTFNVDGAVAQTITGAITGSSANGIINVQNVTAGGVTFQGGAINVKTLDLHANAQLVTLKGATTVADAIELGANQVLKVEGATLNANGGIAADAGNKGGLNLAGGIVEAATEQTLVLNTLEAGGTSSTGANVKVAVDGDVTVANGGVLTLAGNGGSTVGGKLVLNDSGVIHFNHGADNANKVVVTGAVEGGANSVVKIGAGALELNNAAFGANKLEYTGAGTVALNATGAVAANVDFGGHAGTLNLGTGVTAINGAVGGAIGTTAAGIVVVNHANGITFGNTVNIATLTTNNKDVTLTNNTHVGGGINTSGSLTLNGATIAVTGGDIDVASLTNQAGTNSIANKVKVSGLTTVTAGTLTLSSGDTALDGGAAVNDVAAVLAFTHAGGDTASIGGAAGNGSLTGTGKLQNGAGTLNITSNTVSIANIEYTGGGIINVTPVDAGPMVFDSAVNFKGTAGTLAFGTNVGTVNKAITTDTTANTGTVTTAAANTIFNQTVGGDGMALNTVTLGGNAVFENALYTQNLGAAGQNVTFKNAANIATAWGANDVTLAAATVGTAVAPGGDVTIAGKLISTGISTVYSNVMVTGDTEVNSDSLTLSGAGSTLAGVTLGGNTLNFGGASFGAIAGGGTFKLQGTGDVTANGATHAANIVFDTDRALNFANGSHITGDITSTANDGTAGSISGFSQITGNIASHLKAITLDRNAEVAGTMRAATTTSIGGHTLNITGGTARFTAGATDTLYFEATNKTTHGKITVNGEANIHADTTVKIKVIGGDGANLSHGDKLTLVDGTVDGKVATLNAEKLNTDNSTFLLSFTQDTSTTQDLRVMVNRKSSGGSSTGENNQNVGGAMDNMAPVITDPDLKSFEARLLSAKTVEELNALLESVAPDMSGGSVAATVAVGNQTSTIVNNRVNTVRTGDNTGSGIATGNSWQDRFMWAQAFGAKADQGKRGGIAGYDADTYGFVVGMDGEVSDQSRLGIALSYANTDVKAQDVNRSSSDVDSYQISLYGDYDLGSDYFLNGQIAYIYSDVDTKRYDVGGIFGNTASGSFHNNQYSARAEIGKAFDAGHNVSLTPSLLANYNYVDVGSYTEKGAGGLGLRNVSTDHLQILEFGANLIAEANFDDGHGGIFTPSVHGGYRYDVIGDRVATTASFAGGGAAFGVKGADPAQGTFNVGAGLKWDMSSSVNLSAQYDYQTKSDYDEHSGYIRAGYRF